MQKITNPIPKKVTKNTNKIISIIITIIKTGKENNINYTLFIFIKKVKRVKV